MDKTKDIIISINSDDRLPDRLLVSNQKVMAERNDRGDIIYSWQVTGKKYGTIMSTIYVQPRFNIIIGTVDGVMVGSKHIWEDDKDSSVGIRFYDVFSSVWDELMRKMGYKK